MEFLHHLPFYGLAVLCVDDEQLRSLIPSVPRPVKTYGTRPDADVRAVDIAQDGMRTRFRVESSELQAPLAIDLNLPGRHNVLNALAAITVALELGVDDESIARALERFEGVGRRFMMRAVTDAAGRGLLLVDDYGHHPREIAATLAAARAGWPGRRLILVFQPHRYTRTQEQFEDFVEILSTPDVLVLCDVYAAGESPIPGADGRALSRAIRVRGELDPVFAQGPDGVPGLLDKLVRDGDMVLLMGAGDIGALAARLPSLLAAPMPDGERP
jgi:UDP-N-acetylmuramate--alanine ligase